MVWDFFRAIIRPCQSITMPFQASCGKWGGRSPRSNAKGRATGTLGHGFISLMSLLVKDASEIPKGVRWKLKK